MPVCTRTGPRSGLLWTLTAPHRVCRDLQGSSGAAGCQRGAPHSCTCSSAVCCPSAAHSPLPASALSHQAACTHDTAQQWCCCGTQYLCCGQGPQQAVRVALRCQHAVPFGCSVRIVGSHEALGTWDAQQAPGTPSTAEDAAALPLVPTCSAQQHPCRPKTQQHSNLPQPAPVADTQ